MSREMNVATLYCVATPIGNLNDLTQRARDILAQVDMIYAEDTRVTLRLLTHLGIQKPLRSLHDHNESQRVEQTLEALKQGQSIALVSDAGTPLISDPGYKLVKEVSQAGFTITPIPGVSAIITALSVAGLPTDRFSFEGFPAAKRVAREKHLQSLVHDPRTLVFYESCHRIEQTLESMQQIFGAERPAVIARELTKMYETIYRGTLGELYQQLQQDSNMQRGELVVMVQGAEIKEDDAASIEEDQLLAILVDELPVKQAANLAARITGKAKNALYRKAMALKDN